MAGERERERSVPNVKTSCRCGTASTITSKLQYEVRSYGPDHCPRHDDDGHADDNEHWHNCKFTKPWFQTLVMKIAMTRARASDSHRLCVCVYRAPGGANDYFTLACSFLLFCVSFGRERRVCLFITAFAQFRQNKADKLAAANVSELEVGLIDGANKLRPKPTWKSIRPDPAASPSSERERERERGFGVQHEGPEAAERTHACFSSYRDRAASFSPNNNNNNNNTKTPTKETRLVSAF